MTDDSNAQLRLHVPIHLRWGDLDAYNHVNNTSMLKLLEEARVRAFWRPDAGDASYPTAVVAPVSESGVHTVIARQEIEYLRTVAYQREPLDVQIWFGDLGGSSIEVCYEVWNPESSSERVVYARSSAVLVTIDAAYGRPVRLTPEMRAAWQPYLGEPISYAKRR